ncbi:gliding motility lipoprotein GldH [Myroides pelagicus]|uniref:Gliding motility lipoprotein GldH n=2 Tax=Myroides pelagicus TaxID=270914 RepID=A0A7K1GJ76_9FLAO|nr:gliding motility lipoprotein GldH [Myroides pelagicus]MTH28866.1 gliding motility lipoprotein GldH [Myroides pelagicus]
MKNSCILSLIGLVFLSLVGCQRNENIVFDQYQSTNGQWEKKDVKTFVYKVSDTTDTYTMSMNIRANKDYPYNNMYVIFKLYQPNMTVQIDTLQYQMADVNGELLGVGFSDVKESKLAVKEGFVFPESGTYKFTLEHAVRALGEIKGDEYLPGISEVGLSIEKETN